MIVAFVLLFVAPIGESACVQGQTATADCALQPLTFSGLAPVQAGYISVNQGEDKQTHALLSGCYYSLVTSLGKLLFWNRCTGATSFVPPPILSGSSTRFVSVYLTGNQVIVELDIVGFVFNVQKIWEYVGSEFRIRIRVRV